MAYDAITLDSTVFNRARFKLESGLLAQLTQFQNLPADFILSDIVVRELVRHLSQNGKKARDAALSALAEIEFQLLATGTNLEQINAAKALIGDSREVARGRFATFKAATGAEIIEASLCPIDDLLKLYFSSKPPFAHAGDKKSEYPDAIALISLEHWAAREGKRILAVSADKGWKDYAETSVRIDVEEDLGKALQLFQQHAAAAMAGVTRFITAIEEGKLPEIREEIEQALSDKLSEHIFHAEGTSALYFESESAGLISKSFVFRTIGESYDITIVRIGDDEIVARIGVSIKASAMANFSLSVRDGFDKDYVDMGSTFLTKDILFDGALLLTLGEDLGGDLKEVGIYRFDLLGAPREVEFGEVEYDPGDWRDLDDFDDLLDADDNIDTEARADAETSGEAAAGQ